MLSFARLKRSKPEKLKERDLNGMSTQSPYPRKTPSRLSCMVWVDRAVSVLVATYVVIALGADYQKEADPHIFLMAAIGLAPSLLLLIPRTGTMLAVALMSLPCCLGAGMFADATPVPPISDTLLYTWSPFLLGVGLYAAVRAVQIANVRNRIPNADSEP